MSRHDTGPRLVVALDFAHAGDALALAGRLDPARCRVKVGKELFTRAGPAVVRELAALGFGVFLDLKYHDIPNTVAGACRAAAELGVWMVNVHASGGPAMLDAARGALDATGTGRPLLLAVTVLTSLDDGDLAAVGFEGGTERNVSRLAALAAEHGLDGVVCSPRELPRLRAERGERFVLLTPGIRPAGVDTGDQKRVTTPGEALRMGASYLVVGRPITAAPDPLRALAAMDAEIRAKEALHKSRGSVRCRDAPPFQ